MVAWTDIVSALASGGTLIVAGLAAWIGLRQVGEARRLRLEQAQPYIFIDLQSNSASRMHIDFVVKNVGATAAFEIRFDCDPPLRSTLYPYPGQPRWLADYPIFKEGMPYLPPEAEFRFLFEYTADYYARRDQFPERYKVTVTYNDSQGRPCEPATYVLDLSLRFDFLHVDVKTIHDVAKSLDQIRKDTGAISKSVSQVTRARVNEARHKGPES